MREGGECVIYGVQWKEPGDSLFRAIPSDHFAMAIKCELWSHF